MKKNILVVVAHSDDETLGAGGAIKKHSTEGDTVSVISMTNGVGARENSGSTEAEQRVEAANKASEYLVSLKNLNEDTDISYELFNRFGQLDVDKSERVEKNEKQLELPFEKGKKDREDQLKEWANKFWI